MALITDYSSLKDALAAFQERSDVPVDQAIQLAEARFNRLLKTVETNAPLVGTPDSNIIDISALSIVSPIALFIKDGSSSQEYELVPRAAGSFAYSDISAFPTMWSIDGTTITFDCPVSQAYSFRFRYVGRFALSDTAPTNDLLLQNPDIYLCAAMVWGGLFVVDDGVANRYAAPLDAFIREQKSVEERNRRGRLTVDPAIGGFGRNSWGWQPW